MSAMAEYIEPELSFEAAEAKLRAAKEDLDRVSDVLIRQSRLIHKQLHPIVEGGMEKCKVIGCRMVRNVFGQF